MLTSTKPTLEELITGCKAGNRRSQELLYHSLAGKMFAVCLRYLPNRAEAEDMLQNAFIKAFERIDSYKGEGSFEGWLRRLVVNTCLDHYRKNTFHRLTDSMEEHHEEQWSIAPSSQLHAEDLLKLVQQLPEGYRMIFNLYAIEGFSHKEIADQLGISEGTSKSQLSRARQLLQQRLTQHERSSYAIH